jgi:hypothetical protein
MPFPESLWLQAEKKPDLFESLFIHQPKLGKNLTPNKINIEFNDTKL